MKEAVENAGMGKGQFQGLAANGRAAIVTVAPLVYGQLYNALGRVSRPGHVFFAVRHAPYTRASVKIYPRAILSTPGTSGYDISYKWVLRAVLQTPLLTEVMVCLSFFRCLCCGARRARRAGRRWSVRA